MDKFDFKKEYKEFYLPPRTPELVTIPPMSFLAVRGSGDPNQEDGAYKTALSLLYDIAYTIKMSGRSGHRMEGFFDYVVPPLEGLWWQEATPNFDLTRKDTFQWVSLIRLPDFVTREEFNWALDQATEKKQTDFSAVEFFSYEEGLCVQCMHIGPYDSEAATIAGMEAHAHTLGLVPDFSSGRRHHEIYLSDARKCKPERLKTVIRLPVRPK